MFWHAFLASYGVGCFPICHSLSLASFGGKAFSDHGPSFPWPTLYSLCGLISISCHTTSTIPTIMLFNSILLDLFRPAICFPPSDLVCSLGLLLHCLRAPVSHFPLGHPWPICFPWASLAHLLSLGFLGHFPILFSHGPLLTLLGFLDPITSSLIFRADGSSISPLLSLLALLWAYYGPFLLFYILPIGFFSISRPISTCLLPQDPLYKPVSHSFLPLGPNGFFLLANFGLPV